MSLPLLSDEASTLSLLVIYLWAVCLWSLQGDQLIEVLLLLSLFNIQCVTFVLKTSFDLNGNVLVHFSLNIVISALTDLAFSSHSDLFHSFFLLL